MEVRELLLEDLGAKEAGIVQADDSEVPEDGETAHEAVAVFVLASHYSEALILEHFATVSAAEDQVAEQKEEERNTRHDPDSRASEEKGLDHLEGNYRRLYEAPQQHHIREEVALFLVELGREGQNDHGASDHQERKNHKFDRISTCAAWNGLTSVAC